MLLSILVISYNTKELLAGCLTSIAATLSGWEYEVIVVDNASTDGSADLVARDFPEATLLRNRGNAGFAKANNQAILASRGEFVWLLNSDAVLLPGTAKHMVEFMRANCGVGIVGAQLLNPDGTFQESYSDFPTLWGEMLLATKLARLLRHRAYPSYPEDASQRERLVDVVSGACLMARRAAIDEVGLLDEGFFMYSEETDWCYRMRQAGWRVGYVPGAKAIHWGGSSAGTDPLPKRSQLYRSKLLFMRKHYGPLASFAFLLALRLTSCVKLLAWALTSATPDPAKRRLRLQQVRSYATLLRAL